MDLGVLGLDVGGKLLDGQVVPGIQKSFDDHPSRGARPPTALPERSEDLLDAV
jgi:hypothetical protein